jgi:DNA mismatch endonuclease, patch repair protein
MDRLTKEQRKKNMQAVKNRDSLIELKLRKLLWEKGYRYRKNYKKLEGKPDIVLTKYKLAIFCDSEFWHGYDWKNKKKEIKSNKEFWIKKIESNIARDLEVNKILEAQGWKVLRFWGKEIEKNINSCVSQIETIIEAK